jgi:polyisoprenoid-binding protein YceI
MNRILRSIVVPVLAVLLLPQALFAQAPASPEVWGIDKAHSSVMFEVRQLVNRVPGYFRDFDATIQMDRANPNRSSVEFTIQAASLDTREAARDEHLRSPDFFEVTKYPTITFKSVSVAKKSEERFEVTGDLVMHGVTKRITLPVELIGFARDPRGNAIAGFELETTLDRKEYNISWNRVLDEGGVLLGDDVKVKIELRAVKKGAEGTATK